MGAFDKKGGYRPPLGPKNPIPPWDRIVTTEEPKRAPTEGRIGMKLFELRRDEDESGISGTGTVAQGVVFDNGTCVLTWLTEYTSVAVYANIETVIKIHGHGGKTRVVQIANCDKDKVQPVWDKDAHGGYPPPKWLLIFAEKDLGDE